MFNPSDWKAEEFEIKEATLSSNERWTYSVDFTDGTGVSVTSIVDPRDFTLHPGKVTVFSKSGFGLGSRLQGIIQDDWVIFYKTREQDKADHDLLMLGYERARQQSYDNNLPKWLARAAALSEPYRKRLERFNEEHGIEWWKDGGEYELYTLEQSDAMVKHFSQYADPVGMLASFKDLPYDEQRKEFPELSDGHSGNTFIMAVAFAKFVLEGQEI